MRPPGDRVERRRGDRRQWPSSAASTPSAARDSWFGALGSAGDSRPRDDADGAERAGAHEGFDIGGADDPSGDRQQMLRGASRRAGNTESALTRIYRTYAAARAAIGAAMVAGISAASLLGANLSGVMVALCLVYAVESVTLWLLPRFGALTRPQPQDGAALRRRQWLATIGVDLAVFAALHLVASDGSLNLAALLVLPVLMSGVLSSRLMSLATAAAVALMLLAAAWFVPGSAAGSAVLLTQSGLAGMGFFAIALVASELASRLAREEVAARGSLELARQQARLNQLVIEEMADGVLVVDRELRVRAANPAARGLLASRGLSPSAPFQLQSRAEWAALSQAVQRALAQSYWPEAGSEVVLGFGAGDTRTLRLRVRFTRRPAPQGGKSASEDFCVLLLEDVRTARTRLRQERLAAMGRVSAGIAHEIRNPLSAIAQANALLLEDPLPEPQRRLARMVADNVERLKRIVDEVMEVAPDDSPGPRVVDATSEVAAAAAEWAATAQVTLAPQGELDLDLPAQPLHVAFDREHLRRVLVNLLDNARRHGSGAPGAIGVRLAARDEGSVVLRVDSDGPPITQEVERHLFEPFFSTRSRGTGLGLYICRELCERYGASIEYRLRPDGQRNLFLVIMRRETALSAEPRTQAPA
jgi:two-component system sensor histidine kinase PilS (NtrC family)